MATFIISGVLFALAVFMFTLSILSFCNKGTLLNNAYLYASEKERKTMNKKPYYRQSAVVFLLIGLVFICNGAEVLWQIDFLFYIALFFIFTAILYAILSSIQIEKKKATKKRKRRKQK